MRSPMDQPVFPSADSPSCRHQRAAILLHRVPQTFSTEGDRTRARLRELGDGDVHVELLRHLARPDLVRYSSAGCAIAAGSRPAKSQPTIAANAGMPRRMRRSSLTGTLPSAAIPPLSELPRSHPIMPM